MHANFGTMFVDVLKIISSFYSSYLYDENLDLDYTPNMENFKHRLLSHLAKHNCTSMSIINPFLKDYKSTQFRLVYDLKELASDNDIEITPEYYGLKTRTSVDKYKKRYLWTLNDVAIKARITSKGVDSFRNKKYHHKSDTELLFEKFKGCWKLIVQLFSLLSIFKEYLVPALVKIARSGTFQKSPLSIS